MNKPEKLLYKKIKKAMSGLWDHQRHEDKFSVGIPDISFGLGGKNGWIELKYLKKWPKLGDIVKIPHFTSQQKNWIYKRQKIGGNCWLLLQIKVEFLLFKGDDVTTIGCINEFNLRKLVYINLHPDNIRLMMYEAFTKSI